MYFDQLSTTVVEISMKLYYDKSKSDKTGLQPVSRPVDWVLYFGGWSGVESPFDAVNL